MIKVLVAEDEGPISRNIIRAIEKNNSEFSVKYVAYNGKQAKKYLDKEEIDVAFLDIDMPIYDGLWLLEYIKSSSMSVIPVILTGYQEFDYAQKALKNSAFDYLLKPLTKSSLTELLNRIKTELERRKREKLLTDSKIQHEVFEYKEGLTDLCYIASCFLGGPCKGVLLEDTKRRQKATHDFINNYLEERLGKQDYWMANGHVESERLLFLSMGIKNYQEVLEDIIRGQDGDTLPITVAVCTEPVKTEEISEAYKVLRNHAKGNIMLETSSIDFLIARPKAIESTARERLDDILNQIQGSSATDQLLEILRQLVLSTGTRRTDLEYGIKRFFLRLCEKIPTQTSFVDLEEDILTILENEFSCQGLFNKIKKILTDYFYIRVETAENKKALSKEIIEYLDRNYHYPYSNQILEDRFGYSSSYLRAIFREEHGTLPADYLLKVRMEKARTLLKQCNQVKEVAEEVGYSDPFYFSKVFKKYTGLSPKEFIHND